MGAINGMSKSFSSSGKSGIGKNVGGVSTSTSKASVDSAVEKQNRMKYSRYEKKVTKEYNVAREGEIQNVLSSLKTDFQADSVVKEGNIIRVRKGIEEFQFNIEGDNIKYADKVLNIPENMIKEGNKVIQNPKTYTSRYSRDEDGDSKKSKDTYIPYEIILDDKGNIQSEIWRDTYTDIEKKDGKERKEIKKVFVEKQKDYENGNLVREQEWDIFKDKVKKYTGGGYSYDYDPYLEKDTNYKTGRVRENEPDQTRTQNYALQDKMVNYKYTDPYIKIMEEQKKSLTPAAQQRFDEAITVRKTTELNKTFGTTLINPFVQISKPGETSTYNKEDALYTLGMVNLAGSKNPTNVKQFIYANDLSKDTTVQQLQTAPKNFMDTINIKSNKLQSIKPLSTQRTDYSMSTAFNRRNDLLFGNTKNPLAFGQSTSTLRQSSSNQNRLSFGNYEPKKPVDFFKSQNVPKSIPTLKADAFNIFSKKNKDDIKNKIF